MNFLVFLNGEKFGLIKNSFSAKRSPKIIADEIEETHKRLGQITFEFVDSTFNDPKGHAEDICREIIKKNMKINLRTMGINPVNVTSELFNLMKMAGFTQIDCTPDTASNNIIKNMKKNFSKKDLIKAAKIIPTEETASAII